MNLINQTHKLQQYIHDHPDPSIIDEAKIVDIYQELIDCVIDHNHLYYINSQPIISDKEYDDLFTYLKKIEEYFPHIISSNSPTQNLIGQVAEGFNQATHTIKLLSLENSYNAQDLTDRDEFIAKHLQKNTETINPYTYILEPKFDGISVELIYKNGIFHQAITRGDGVVGDDITNNVKTIKNIPTQLTQPIDLQVRGEIMMPKSVRHKINEAKEKNNETPFANTRNAAAGSIKLLDSGEVAKRGLVCYVYDILACPDNTTQTHEQAIQYLQTLGLPIFNRYKKADTIQQVIDTCLDPTTQEFFHQQDTDFDGLVIKLNELPLRDILGSTQHHPRRGIAYKFPAQQMSTQIISVDRQVGRTGIITPVANLAPIQLSGVTISRVSLHNIDFINTKDIHINDYVRVQRSGEVIPYITGVIKEKRQDNTTQIQAPDTCPSCGHTTTHIDMHTYCTNNACPAQLQEKIEHFVSKQCMDIEGIGESIAALLIQQNLVTTVDQLYQFQTPEKQLLLRSLPGFADKKIYEITTQLEQSKKQPLRRLLHGLGIPNIGKKTAMMIEEAIQKDNPDQQTFTLKTLIQYVTKAEFLEQIYGIGDKMIVALQAFFHDTSNISIVQNLVKQGINISPFTSQKVQSPYSNIRFSITGTFPIDRNTIVAACEQQGMIFDPSPTQKTTYMIVGENAGSKVQKAQEMQIQIIQGRLQAQTILPFLAHIPQTHNINKPTAQSLF